jgi:DNA-binding PadR family transcriptional regulator
LSVRNALLGLVAQHPCHGYELHAAFEALVGGKENWDVKPAQIYTTLIRLHEAGLLDETMLDDDSGPEKRVYSITPAGRAELEDWFRTGEAGSPQRDSVYLKLMLVMGLNEPAEMGVILQKQRAVLFQELHRVTDLRQRCDPRTELAKILLMDKAVMHLEADLRWLDMVEGRLDDMQKQPLPQPEIRPRGRPRK